MKKGTFNMINLLGEWHVSVVSCPAAPGQLRGLLSLPVYGMPVYISIPEHCRLGVGQLLTVEFPRAVM